MSSTMCKDMAFSYGVIEQVSPLIRRVVCKNPSPFTLYGTGTYIIGHGSVAVVDPGPAEDEHIDAILSGLGEERVSHIVVTHTHLDHSPGCRLLQPRVDAKTHGFGPHPRSGPDARGVEEGVDHGGCEFGCAQRLQRASESAHWTPQSGGEIGICHRDVTARARGHQVV